MKRTTTKRTLAEVLGKNIVAGDTITLSPKKFADVDLGSATMISSLRLTNWPIKGGHVVFDKGDSRWQISVTFTVRNTCAEENEIWNAALQIASRQLGIKLVKTPDRRWMQRLTLPLHRDGDDALQFVRNATTLVFHAAQVVLQIVRARQPQMLATALPAPPPANTQNPNHHVKDTIRLAN